jgi:hypothetical protein
MRRTMTALVATATLLLVACGDGDDEAATTTTTTEADGGDGEDWRPLVPCENADDGYTIDRPEPWETNSADAMAPCSLFDPEPIDVDPGTQIPLDIAVRVTVDAVDHERVATEDQRGEEVLAFDEPVVADLTTTRIEARAEGDTVLRPEGSVETRWLVDLGDGRTLVAATTDVAGDYERNRAVLDAMVGTLTLTDEGDGAGTTTTTTAPADEGPDPVGSPGTGEVSSPDFPGGFGDTAFLTDVRVAARDGFDRIVFQLDGDEPPSYRVAYADGPVREAGSGREVDVAGSHALEVILEPASRVDLTGEELVEIYEGPDRLGVPGAARVTEVVLAGDFEANMSWAIGVDGEVPFGVTMLRDPLRLVVDVVDG